MLYLGHQRSRACSRPAPDLMQRKALAAMGVCQKLFSTFVAVVSHRSFHARSGAGLQECGGTFFGPRHGRIQCKVAEVFLAVPWVKARPEVRRSVRSDRVTRPYTVFVTRPTARLSTTAIFYENGAQVLQGGTLQAYSIG